MLRTTLFHRYLELVILVGALVLYSYRPQWDEQIIHILFFTLLVVLSEMATIPLPNNRGTVSVSGAIIHALYIIYGIPATVWVAALGTTRWRDVSGQVPLRVVLFNRSMLAISAMAGGEVYKFLGGEIGTFTLRVSTLPFALAAVSYTFINAGLALVAFAVRDGASPLSMWHANMKWSLPNMFALIPMSILIAQVHRAAGMGSVALFFIPLLMARQAFQRYVDMRASYLQTMLALSAALDAKDATTHGHSARVAELAVKAGRKLGVTLDELEILEYAGVLHDIGKIGIPDQVLNKAGMFTRAEYELMKRHPTLGSEIIKGIKLLEQGKDWIKHHHERYDGSGYPDGLVGEDIPLGARILAAADAFDAMTSARPYKEAYSWDMARSELLRCSGTQFDPQVVKAFLLVLDEEQARADREA